MKWVPTDYVLDSGLLDIIVSNFIAPPATSLQAARCFQEIVNLKVKHGVNEGMYREKIVFSFCKFIAKVKEIMDQRY